MTASPTIKRNRSVDESESRGGLDHGGLINVRSRSLCSKLKSDISRGANLRATVSLARAVAFGSLKQWRDVRHNPSCNHGGAWAALTV